MVIEKDHIPKNKSFCQPGITGSKKHALFGATPAQIIASEVRYQDRAGNMGPGRRLIFAGREVQDGRTLQDYGIQDGAKLYNVLLLGRTPDSRARIFVDTPSKPGLEVVVVTDATLPNARVADIKKAIEDKHGLPIEDQGLFFKGKELEDDHTLGDYSIEGGFHIDLIVRA
jgi:ubiquitin C